MAYIRALTEALPARFADFLAEAHPDIVSEAAVAFGSEDHRKEIDPDHDYAVIRGSWTAGGCDYEAIAQLTAADIRPSHRTPGLVGGHPDGPRHGRGLGFDSP